MQVFKSSRILEVFILLVFVAYCCDAWGRRKSSSSSSSSSSSGGGSSSSSNKGSLSSAKKFVGDAVKRDKSVNDAKKADKYFHARGNFEEHRSLADRMESYILGDEKKPKQNEDHWLREVY